MAVEVDGAGEAGAVLQGEVQCRDTVHRDGAVQGLGVGGQLDLCAVLARSAPAVGGGVARNGHQVGGAVSLKKARRWEKRDKNAKTQGREPLFEDFMNERPSLSEQARGTAVAENKKAT